MNPIIPKQNFLDLAINWISPERGNKRLIARLQHELALQYSGADTSRLRSNWILGADTSTPDMWELETLRNRSRDLNRNDPVASGATETMGINIIGRGLRPQARIRAERLSVSEERAREINIQAETIWDNWTPRADSGNRLNFDEIQFLALRKIVEDGETLALPIMGDEPWRKIKRCIELIEADRLMATEDPTGIKIGDRGEPLSYNIQKADSTDTAEINAFDNEGRPKILHVFQTKRPGQLRGVPLFAPVINFFKDLVDYLEAEVVAARVAACLAVFVTKQDAYSAAYNIAGGGTDASGNRVQGIEPGMVGYLNPGESIDVVDPKRPGDSFSSFIESILRLIGVALNMPYEILVKDFSKTNYSSARAALLEGRRMFMTWRNWFAQKFCQPIRELVLEEAYLRGIFDVPDFYKFKFEYTRALWIGGGWGWVEPVKEIEASRKAIDYGLSTHAEEAAGQGRDWEEVFEQIKRENDKANELKISLLKAGKTGGNQDAQTEKE